jgi:capsular polysaccharide transport system ATP-binding protein
MIEFDGVTKSYRVGRGRNTILDDVSFFVPAGIRLGVLGINGAGKTALLRLIAGAELPDRGRITRFGRVSFPIGFTGTFNRHLSARENVAFLARLYGADERAVQEWIEAFCELGAYYDMPTGTYSSGMWSRIAFATSFAFDFDVYLVDEAIETGDSRFRSKCAAAFDERMRTASLILVSHNIHTIRQYCETAAVLHRGRLLPFPTIDEALGFYEETLTGGAPSHVRSH